ncbi:MAG: 4-alpha-glucanotransferase, partial [Planctomycetia bacterium]
MNKTWGIFLPLYAAKSERNLGAGDFQDLEALLEWTVSKGGKVVGTLPMLAAFLDEPFEYSPYSPASRLFWNEFYLAIEKIPELERNQPAKGLIQSAEFQKESARLRDADLVDYRGVMALKRQVLQLLADGFAQNSTEARKDQFRSFIEGNPAVVDYARFRAAAEKFKTSWHIWPESFKIGNIDEKQLDSKAILYHQLVQWWCSEQMGALAKKAASLGANGLYLDLPLGVNADSYDVYRHRELFALGASGGAPPDGFFTLGQDWGFPPMLPEEMLKDGFSYLRSVLRHHMNSASS